MARLLIIIGIKLFFSCQIFATAQIPDYLIYQGDTLKLFANPLEQFSGMDSLRSKFFTHKTHSTACWRGYIAQWIFVKNELFLDKIYSCVDRSQVSQITLKQLFGCRFSNGRVKADWVNATLLAPHGKQLFYIHMGYESIYEEELEFRVKNGQLIKVSAYDNSKSQKSIYSEDKTLRQFIYSHINWKKLPNEEVKVVVQFSANEKGLIDQIKIVKGHNEIYDQEALRVVRAIPNWDVFYLHGKHFRLPWNLPIHFSAENRKKYRP